MITAAVPTTCLYARYAFRSHPQRPQYCAHRFPIGPCCAGVPRAKRHQAPAYRAIPRAQRNRAPAYRADLAEASWVQAVKLYIASALCALALCFPDVGYAEPLFTKKPAFTTDYATAVRKREGKTKSNLPSAREAEALLEINEELFTTEALEGMSRIVHYAQFVEGLKDAEEAPGCEHCTDNRLLIEHAWQVVANEFFDPAGHFSQARWADQLLQTFQAAKGGCLHNRLETYSAAEHMMASLGDQYSQFLPPSQHLLHKHKLKLVPAQAFVSVRRGLLKGSKLFAFSATGSATNKLLEVLVHALSLRHEGTGWLVDAAMAESPAEESGIIRGDRIIEINGYPVDTMNQHEVNELQRGPLGSTTVLTIAPKDPSQEVKTVYLERRPLPQPPLKQALIGLPDGPTVSYLRVHYFCSEGTRAFIDAVNMSEFWGVDGYIIDLRNNPGGVFEEAIATANLLLHGGQQIAQTVRTATFVDNTWKAGALSKTIFPALPGLLTSKPVVVLTNASTASASEVLAGALHGNGRAQLIGEKTFGKGVVQYYFPMTDGSGIRLTIAKYLTPGHYDITASGGLQPDLACSDFPHGDRVTADNDACILAGLNVLSQEIGDVSGNSKSDK